MCFGSWSRGGRNGSASTISSRLRLVAARHGRFRDESMIACMPSDPKDPPKPKNPPFRLPDDMDDILVTYKGGWGGIDDYPQGGVYSSEKLLTGIVEAVGSTVERRKQIRALEDRIRVLTDQNERSALEKAELEEKVRLNYLLSRLPPAAQEVLLSSQPLKDSFLKTTECPAFVVSIDIRRSTELMLKARSAQAFSAFILGLCDRLKTIVGACHGVFDKFTGDGILAFFPDFYSGPDAAYLALLAADRSHAAFNELYRQSRGVFNSILKDTGLGIGIDYGQVHLVQMAGGLTVVGAPVVYACRFGGAPPGCTLANHAAYEQILARNAEHVMVREAEIEIKHDGPTLAYDVRLNGREFSPAPPGWLKEAQEKAGKERKG